MNNNDIKNSKQLFLSLYLFFFSWEKYQKRFFFATGFEKVEEPKKNGIEKKMKNERKERKIRKPQTKARRML